MSVWTDLESMLAFRNGKVHTEVARNLTRWCDEAFVGHWETADDELPAWDEAHRRMIESGRQPPIKFQSEDHRARRIRKPYVNKNWLDVLPRKRRQTPLAIASLLR
jgi:hypothetical protein